MHTAPTHLDKVLVMAASTRTLSRSSSRLWRSSATSIMRRTTRARTEPIVGFATTVRVSRSVNALAAGAKTGVRGHPYR